MCKRFLLCFGTFLLSGIICALCFVGVDASAADTFSQWSVSDTASFYGDMPFTYEIAGTRFSSTFSYLGGVAYGHDFISAVNIESNSVLSTANSELYDVLVYAANVRYTDSPIRNISIPVDIYVTGGFRTFFGIVSSLEYSSNSPNPNFAQNSIADFPNNFISGGGAALPSASSPSYYNASSIRFVNSSSGGSYYGVTMRSLTFDAVDGTIAQLNFDGAYCISDTLYLFVATPYSYGDVSHDSPTTTPPVTTAPSSGGQTIINNNVDLTETHSILGGISNFLQSIWESIRSIPQSILNGIQAIFIPEEGYFDDKVAALKDKFSWYSSISSAWSEFYTAFSHISDDSPPSISMTLDNRSYFGGSIGTSSSSLLVLDWFVQYRTVIRTLISAFMWIFFLWRVYCHIPNIISGSGMEVQKTDEGAAWTIHGHKL